VHHHRYTGAADGNWRNMIKNGVANYIAGYHPLFMLFKCIKRSWERPYGLGALGLGVGFLSGYMKRIPQISDTLLIRYVRQQQINLLLGRASIWK